MPLTITLHWPASMGLPSSWPNTCRPTPRSALLKHPHFAARENLQIRKRGSAFSSVKSIGSKKKLWCIWWNPAKLFWWLHVGNGFHDQIHKYSPSFLQHPSNPQQQFLVASAMPGLWKGDKAGWPGCGNHPFDGWYSNHSQIWGFFLVGLPHDYT